MACCRPLPAEDIYRAVNGFGNQTPADVVQAATERESNIWRVASGCNLANLDGCMHDCSAIGMQADLQLLIVHASVSQATEVVA